MFTAGEPDVVVADVSSVVESLAATAKCEPLMVWGEIGATASDADCPTSPAASNADCESSYERVYAYSGLEMSIAMTPGVAAALFCGQT